MVRAELPLLGELREVFKHELVEIVLKVSFSWFLVEEFIRLRNFGSTE